MKVFTACLLVALSCVLIGETYGSPSSKRLLNINLEGVLTNLLQTTDDLVTGLVTAVHDTVQHISESLLNVVRALPSATEEVIDRVNDLIRETGSALVFTVDQVLDDVLTFTGRVSGVLTKLTVNLENREVRAGEEWIGNVNDEGALVDLAGNIIGLLDSEDGVLIVVGKAVNEIQNLVGNLLGTLGGFLGGLLG